MVRKGHGKWLLTALILLLVFMTPFFMWLLKEERPFNVAIIDKTVPDFTYREHSGLMWLLNHQKYQQSNSQPYVLDEDYFGFFPQEEKKFTIRPPKLERNHHDLIYLADTYGVYKEEYYDDTPPGNRSESLYGGLQQDELAQVKSLIYQGTPLITEFNTFGSPTRNDVRQSLYKILGLKWSGWIGRYFADLSRDGEVPAWAIKDYEKQYGKKWTFTGEGYLFADENDFVVVLEKHEIKEDATQFATTKAGEAYFGQPLKARYNYWFDIVTSEAEQAILANYTLNVTKAGAERLEKNGIPTTFPAVIRNDTGVYKSFYFAGDFADNEEVPFFHRFTGLDGLVRALVFETKDSLQPFYWNVYTVMMERILDELYADKVAKQPPQLPAIATEDGVQMRARTNGMKIEVYKDGKWVEQTVKGVNMGMAVPGRWFTEFPKDESDYLRWFQMIHEMKSNTIRVYTLMDPAFYRALYVFNQKHKDSPLWLMQEVWPEEHPPGQNFLDKAYDDAFKAEIKRNVDAIHGKANITERKGRAYGNYTYNVAPYVLGYLVGRELEPDEVLATDKKNKGFTYMGDYISTPNGTPTESWLALSMDYLMQYEAETYNWQHPTAIVSWPTLDPMTHPSEWNEKGDRSKLFNDKATVTILNFARGPKLKAGYFGAYHIYPNYPDFMNNEQQYDQYKDEEGRLRYGGYLQQFMKYHKGVPAVVAEFGLATGMGVAHYSPDGYHHGGMTEHEQGEGIVRMFKAMLNEGYAGGLIFEWMDEWAKKTWTTEPFMIPYEHHVYWHNVIDPEQNYGLLAMEPAKPIAPQYTVEQADVIRKLEMRANESFVYVDIELKRPLDWTKETLHIGLDTYDPQRGETKLSPKLPVTTPNGMEYLVQLTGKKASQLLVTPSYNIARTNYMSRPSNKGLFEKINPIVNKAGVRRDGTTYEAKYEDGSMLKYGQFDDGTNAHWYVEGNTVYLRLPWTRLNVSDPTTHRVINDAIRTGMLERDMLKTVKTDGIRPTLVVATKQNRVVDQLLAKEPFLWPTWKEPRYNERLKDGYRDIQTYFSTIR